MAGVGHAAYLTHVQHLGAYLGIPLETQEVFVIIDEYAALTPWPVVDVPLSHKLRCYSNSL